MQDIKVAIISMENWVGEIDRSIQRIEEWTIRASENGAELVLFPEMCVGGWHVHPRIDEYAQEIPGKISERIGLIARKNNCIISYGTIEHDNGKYYNTQVLVDGKQLCATQRKLHLPINESECSAGENLTVVDIGKAKIGTALCRDAFFPSTFRSLYKQGAEIVLIPLAYWTMPREQYIGNHIHAAVMRSMCWIYGIYGLFVNSAGLRLPNQYCPEELEFPGWAGIYDPLGETVAYTFHEGNDEQMIISTLTNQIITDRRNNPHFIGKDDR